jgi:hypothetical protein
VLLADLRGTLDEETWQRVAQLVESADERIAWIRGVREAKQARKADPATSG